MTTSIENEAAPDYARRSSRPYTEVLELVKAAAQAGGLRVLAVHDLAASMADKGFQREAYAVVEVCNAKIAHGVLAADERLGALMPCRVAVYSQGDGTVVSSVLPSRLMSLFPPNRLVSEAASEVDRLIRGIVDAAA